MLLEHILACALIGLITAGVMTYIITEGKSNIVMFFMLLFGATFGWIVGMIFIFVTGGLELSVPWLVLPVITTAFASTLMLYKFRNIGAIFVYSLGKSDRVAAIFSVVILFVLIGSLVIIALPQGYSSSYNTQTFSAKDISFKNVATTLSTSQARHLNAVTPTGLVPITFDVTKSSVSFPRIAENPEQGDYLEFQLTFDVASGGGHWEQPYIGMCVFQDSNGNGQPDSGEAIWSDLNYKGPTDPAVKYWRANCIYNTDGSTYAEIFVAGINGEMLLMPIFHANAISSWKTDSSYNFPNTPQGYTPPNDMLSWEISSGGSVTLKETVTSFASVSAGGSVTFEGKIYCPDGSAGSHGLLIRAFDMRYTDPFTPNEDPLAEHVMSFYVESGNGPVCGNGICEEGETYENCPEDCEEGGPVCGNGVCEEGENAQNCPEDCGNGYPDVDITATSWVTMALLGLGTIGGAGIVITKGPKLLK